MGGTGVLASVLGLVLGGISPSNKSSGLEEKVAELCKDSYQKGYDQAFAEMYTASGNDDHTDRCDSDACRACGVIKTVIEDVVHQLTAFMTEEEFWVFTGLTEVMADRRDAERAKKRNKRNGHE